MWLERRFRNCVVRFEPRSTCALLTNTIYSFTLFISLPHRSLVHGDGQIQEKGPKNVVHKFLGAKDRSISKNFHLNRPTTVLSTVYCTTVHYLKRLTTIFKANHTKRQPVRNTQFYNLGLLCPYNNNTAAKK